jgi:hypothetical protein
MRLWHGVVVLIIICYFVWGRSPSTMPKESMVYYDKTSTVQSSKRRLNCPENRCLTIYLAPWCSVCRNSHTAILDVVKQLETQGIETTIVLGLDKHEALVAYAADFPFPVYFDQNKALFESLEMKAVPSYVVWLPSRKITTRKAGGTNSAAAILGHLELKN